MSNKNFRDLLFNKKVNKKELFQILKTNHSFEDQLSLIKQVPKVFSNFIYGNCLPTNASKHASIDKSYIDSVEAQINWLCHQFKYYKEEIGKFIKLKEEYEKSFLLGNYEKSAQILKDVSSNICFSYWGLENEFLQAQYEKGLEFNFKLLNACKDNNINSGEYFYLIHFFSYKVEEDISFISYQNSLNTSIKPVNHHYKEYFNYRLNPLEYRFSDLESLFWVNSNFPIIDKYILLRDVFIHLILDERNQFSDLAYNRSKFLLEHFCGDILLHKVVNYFDINISDEYLVSPDKLQIIDDFTTGNYIQVISSAKAFLNESPNDISIIELYIKAHLYLEQEICPINEKKALINDIISLMYNYLCKNNQAAEAFVDLITLTNAIANFDFSKELISFLERNMQRSGDKRNRKAYFYSKHYNPLHYSVYETKEDKQNYLKSINQLSDSITISFFDNLLGTFKPELFDGVIPLTRLNFYHAGVLYERGDFVECKAVLENILSEIHDINYLHEIAVKQLFECYFNLLELDKAINLFVDTFIKNEQLVSHIETKKVIDLIVKQRFKNVSHSNIKFPIFVFLTQAEIHSKFISYDLFMRSQAFSRPTEIVANKEHLESTYILFLKAVANPKIISRKAMVFKNSSEVLKERIAICQALSKIDEKRTEEYINEISEHTQRLTVQQRIKEIDQSMIYVDESGIISHELSEVNKSFNRFKNISELLNHKKMDATGINYDALVGLLVGDIDTDTYKKSLRKTDLQFELFTHLFIEVRDKFLFSNHYGLDYYLSQRIRHGTIIGQIRKQFQELNLVTSKTSKDGVYLPDTYWSESVLNLSGTDKVKFQERMAEFSKKIDSIISDLKDKFIQIRTEDPTTIQTGWFSYMYIPEWDKTFLYSLFIQKVQFITDFQEFINLIFESLWEITTKNLEKIRIKIDKDVKGQLIKELDDLEVDLGEILGKNSTNRIFKSIADCRTNVQSGVDTVIRWFNKSKNDEIDFTLEDAFNTSLKIVNNINSPSVIYFEELLESKTLFRGAYFPHVVDLLKIFITNIFNYYKSNNLLDTPGCVKFTIEDQTLDIEFLNRLSEQTDYEALSSKINAIKQGLMATNYKGIRGEGNTGFTKANNILKNVFRRKSNEITFNISENTFKINCRIDIKHLVV